MLLDDKRRRGDIGKQDALRKSQLKYIEHITTVMNNDAETPESSKDTRLGTFLSGQGLLKADTSDTQQNPDEQQNHKKYPASLRFLSTILR